MSGAAAKYIIGPDCQSIIWAGVSFALSPRQARVVQVLVDAARRGIREIRQTELVVAADTSGRLAEIFRDRDPLANKLVRNPALGSVVVPGRRGAYRLGIPDGEDFLKFAKSITLSTSVALYDATQPREGSCMYADAFPTINHDPPPIASTARMAAKLGVPQKTLRDWADRGLVPSLPAGRGRRLFNIRATEEAVARLAAGEVPLTPPPAA